MELSKYRFKIILDIRWAIKHDPQKKKERIIFHY